MPNASRPDVTSLSPPAGCVALGTSSHLRKPQVSHVTSEKDVWSSLLDLRKEPLNFWNVGSDG